jgi:maltooligosyltrehalose trehalohydrolase
MPIGALRSETDTCTFLLWAPLRRTVELELESPEGRRLPMHRDDNGTWRIETDGISPGALYRYRLDGEVLRPDPASHFQPEGVHGPSEVVDHDSFQWSDQDFRAPPFDRLIFYELHVGTFSPEGTFAGVEKRLDRLVDLGVNAIELMPVAAFPGERNWGYDGVYPFAVQSSYGGPDQLKRLVDACHRRGLAVVLDVVYNHLGPEGNYLRDFGPYFTDTYRTPWGEAINFDGPYSDEVRRFFLENALHWFSRYHIDCLRLDAVHAIYDCSAHPFLLELAEETAQWSRELGRPLYLIAESDLNDARLIRSPETGGMGLRAQWSDDFHHAVHAYLTGERNGYYLDFGDFDHVVKAVRDGFVYDRRYSRYRKRHHGNSCQDLPADRLVVCIQNHDQVGNRMLGERLSSLVSFQAFKIAAAVLLLGPNVPLLFMGQEHGEQAPFQYFVNHGDPELVEAVRRGRRDEFQSFAWAGELPDPQDPDTFLRSRLTTQNGRDRRRVLLDFHRELIRLRGRIVNATDPPTVSRAPDQPVLILRYPGTRESFLCLFNFGEGDALLDGGSLFPGGAGRIGMKIFDSSLPRWLAPDTLRPGGTEEPDTSDSAPRLQSSPIELTGYSAVVYNSVQ